MWLLYLAYPRMPDGSPARSSRLMRMPFEGGPERTVFNLGGPQLPWIESIQGTPDFRCPTQSTRPCILSESDNVKSAIVFSAFDPAIARKQELMRLTIEPGDGIAWDLSPDGSQIAYCRNYKDYREDFQIKVMELASGATREIPVKGWNACQFLAWSQDSKAWFAGSYSPQGGSMLFVEASGKVHFLQKSSHRYLSARASRDGRFLAYTETTAGGNAWMIDNLP
jgi:WD40-like Beta Propeller Repeat